MRYSDFQGKKIEVGSILKVYKGRKSVKVVVEKNNNLLSVRKIDKKGNLSQKMIVPLKEVYQKATKIEVLN